MTLRAMCFVPISSDARFRFVPRRVARRRPPTDQKIVVAGVANRQGSAAATGRRRGWKPAIASLWALPPGGAQLPRVKLASPRAGLFLAKRFVNFPVLHPYGGAVPVAPGLRHRFPRLAPPDNGGAFVSGLPYARSSSIRTVRVVIFPQPLHLNVRVSTGASVGTRGSTRISRSGAAQCGQVGAIDVGDISGSQLGRTVQHNISRRHILSTR
jgi:hypothetical protein